MFKPIHILAALTVTIALTLIATAQPDRLAAPKPQPSGSAALPPASPDPSVDRGVTGEGDCLGWELIFPNARRHHTAVFDEARQVVVTFGGHSGYGFLGETLEWDGARTDSAPSTARLLVTVTAWHMMPREIARSSSAAETLPPILRTHGSGMAMRGIKSR